MKRVCEGSVHCELPPNRALAATFDYVGCALRDACLDAAMVMDFLHEADGIRKPDAKF